MLLYGTGAGVLTPAAQDGQIGGKDATVVYAGTASGLTNALLQMNVQIPAGLAPGPQPVVWKVGGLASSATVTVAVQ